MWLAFPEFKDDTNLNALMAIVDRPISYATSHFTEYFSLMDDAIHKELKLAPSTSDTLTQNYEPFNQYVLSVNSYCGYQGMIAAGQEFYQDAVTDPVMLQAQIERGIQDYLDSKFMRERREAAIAGILRNSHLLQKPQDERDYLIACARRWLSTRYLSVIGGYTYAAVHLTAYHQCDWDADAAERLQKAFLKLQIDKKIDDKITLANTVL